jgi:hypothetical protein
MLLEVLGQLLAQQPGLHADRVVLGRIVVLRPPEYVNADALLVDLRGIAFKDALAHEREESPQFVGPFQLAACQDPFDERTVIAGQRLLIFWRRGVHGRIALAVPIIQGNLQLKHLPVQPR